TGVQTCALPIFEAMKVEIAFSAPLAGVVTEIRAPKGQPVAAGDVLIVIEPETERAADEGAAGSRLTLGPDTDPLGVDAAGGAGASYLSALDAREASERRAAITALREEIRTVLLGYDADPERARWLAAPPRSADGRPPTT